MTLYAKWTIISCTVTFNSNGGSAAANQTVNYGSTVTKPADPTKTGNTFGGWFSDSALKNAWTFTAQLSDNLTLYAKWTPANYTVTFDSNGGSAVANLTIPVSCNVTFNANGGSAVSGQTVPYGSAVTKPADPTKEGSTFAGWYSDAGLSNAWDFTNGQVAGNTTLYAKWAINEYLVYFNVNDGSAIENQTIPYGSAIIKPADPAKAGYSFAGWYTDDYTFADAWDFSAVPNKDITLSAKWIKAGSAAPWAVGGACVLLAGSAGAWFWLKKRK
ncbi:MAG: InlB B-repeat-containing protein [Defluviitaleaceae bacterium]|nr:InlB B-repeat-containing protein [Defluviitaleaceae bacterium]